MIYSLRTQGKKYMKKLNSSRQVLPWKQPRISNISPKSCGILHEKISVWLIDSTSVSRALVWKSLKGALEGNTDFSSERKGNCRLSSLLLFNLVNFLCLLIDSVNQQNKSGGGVFHSFEQHVNVGSTGLLLSGDWTCLA